ncbi:hypothetical protein [Halococcus salsus]|uniref:hypothetical protein n=1 Tax=Halococcus salsus TaxID=2162894 RepID=UPI0013597DA1|nr:hypothetical protein [Halococcus salsus]
MSEDWPVSADGSGSIAAGDRYRLDDGTTLEVVGVADDEVDVVQYDDEGDRLGEYSTSVEEFREDVVDLAE